MGHKLAGLFGIIAATLAFGIGVTVEAGHSDSPRSTQQVVADDKGPTVIGTHLVADDKGPTVIVHTDDDKGPTVVTDTVNDDKGPTVITDTVNDDKGPTSPAM
ncbi:MULTISPECIES: hypothetical protein [unclassified Streptomyces]|uniref:hypothetical protein n=1 Tax=unclassified Streptomyces TaxID=2593676 RepID=UPI0020339824|nr:hypothetical protein [Streptomyces sp. RKAG290]MCM2415393.1 hypothetical protein [Streptomyces sp. RKAG290]